MKKEKVFLFVLLAMVVSGCSGGSSKASLTNFPETPFSENGISFTCPAGWFIDETEEDEDGFYVCVEKDGDDDSGLVMIMAFSEPTDAEEYMDAYQEQLEEQGVFDKLKFGNLVQDTYGSYSGVSKKYSANVMGIPHQGKITVLTINGKTVGITWQEANEDSKKNEKGFETIEQSFRVE